MRLALPPLPRLIASGFGSGFFPVAPGTAGSAVALALGAGLLAVSPWALLAAAIVASLGGVLAVRRCEGAAYDPGWIVIDEFAGQFIALLALPRPSLPGLALGFVAFRAFDILKPGPVGWADRKGGAVGVMLDDIIAGALALLVVYVGLRLLPGWFA